MVAIGDQGSNNHNLFEKQPSMTISQLYVMVDEKKVFGMYDPPQMLKNFRNNPKNHGFIINGAAINLHHIKEFFNRDSSTKTGIGMAPN